MFRRWESPRSRLLRTLNIVVSYLIPKRNISFCWYWPIRFYKSQTHTYHLGQAQGILYGSFLQYFRSSLPPQRHGPGLPVVRIPRLWPFWVPVAIPCDWHSRMQRQTLQHFEFLVFALQHRKRKQFPVWDSRTAESKQNAVVTSGDQRFTWAKSLPKCCCCQLSGNLTTELFKHKQSMYRNIQVGSDFNANIIILFNANIIKTNIIILRWPTFWGRGALECFVNVNILGWVQVK